MTDRLPNAGDTVRVKTLETSRPWFAGKLGTVHGGAMPIQAAGGRWVYPVILELKGLRHSSTEIVWFPAGDLEIIKPGRASTLGAYQNG